MELLFSFLGYLILFIILCFLIAMVFTLINIYKKSFKPQKALVFSTLILIVFVINSWAIYFSFVSLFNSLDNNMRNNEWRKDNNPELNF